MAVADLTPSLRARIEHNPQPNMTMEIPESPWDATKVER